MMWQDIDPVGFIVDFKDRIYHVDCKDTRLRPKNGRAGVLGSHLPWGDPRRGWDFVSTGHGDVPWEDSFRALESIGYTGPISIEWEDAGMDRLHGAKEAVGYIRSLLWKLPDRIVRRRFQQPGLIAVRFLRLEPDPPERPRARAVTAGRGPRRARRRSATRR